MAHRHTAKSIRPSHKAIVKAPGLLPMLYTLGELSRELDIPLATFNDWRKLGMPCRRDARGHVWICGPEFAEWLDKARRRRQKLKSHEVYCVHCREVTQIVQIQRVVQDNITRLNGLCAKCGRTVTRGVR